MRAALAAAALLLVCAPAARAQVRASGYLKNLGVLSRSPSTGEAYDLDLSRVRLSLDGAARAGDWGLSARADYDHELRLGSYLRSAEFRSFGLAEPPSYLTMDQAIAAGSDANYRHRLYRGWVEAARGDVHLRFGRQRIAWGTGKLWNPTDVLNPFVPTTVERDERAGVDALYARTGLGELGQAESAWTLARDWAGSDLLGRLRGNRAGTDFSAMGGKVAGSTGSWMAGGDFASDLAGGSLHGEAAYVDPRTAPPYWRALAGYETTLSAAAPEPFKDLWALAEVYRNGQGSVHPARYDFSALLTGRTISLGKDYAGAGLRKDLHPLVQLEIYQLVNLDDGSAFFAPALDWNALANLHLSGGWQRFSGGRGTEYGRLANLAFLQAQYFF